MSVVDNCILSFSIMENEGDRIADVNRFFGEHKPFISVHDDKLPNGWYGGTKYLETPLLIAAFNYFEEVAFIKHLKTIGWKHPENVQLMIQRQDDDVFSIVTIT